MRNPEIHQEIDLPRERLINNLNTAFFLGDAEGIKELLSKYNFNTVENDSIFKEVLRKGLLNLRELSRTNKTKALELKEVIDLINQTFHSKS